VCDAAALAVLELTASQDAHRYVNTLSWLFSFLS
jgi:hypothetical protein